MFLFTPDTVRYDSAGTLALECSACSRLWNSDNMRLYKAITLAANLGWTMFLKDPHSWDVSCQKHLATYQPMKKCRRCAQEKSIYEYGGGRGLFGRSSNCKSCMRALRIKKG